MSASILSDALVTSLSDLGLSYIFGVSGANIEHIHDSIEKNNHNNIQSVLCKSEFGAGFIAGAYAKYAKTLGLCCATSGGGMMNLVVALAEAKASGVPLLAIIGSPPTPLVGQGAFQDASGGDTRVDAYALCKAVSKYTAIVTAENFWAQFEEALSQALSDVQGPSVLLIPREVMSENVLPPPPSIPKNLNDFKKRRSIDSNNYEEFVQQLNTAESPVVIAGAALLNNHLLVDVINKLSIPVATTLEASGVFPHSNKNFLGVMGVAGHVNVHAALIQSDCIIVLGSQLKAMTRAPIQNILKEKNIWIVNDNIADVPQWSNIQTLCCNTGLFVEKLNTESRITKKHSSEAFKDIVYFDAPTPEHFKEEQGLLLQETLNRIQPHLSNFKNILMDAGNCAASAAHYLSIPDNSQSYIALGMGGMGYAVAGSIGAQLANNNGKTIVICGDGAFLITGPEIHTAIEMQLPILWVIFNDSQHGMCTSRQRFLFESRLTTAQYTSVDFSLMAKGLANNNNFWVRRAERYTQINELLKEYTNLQAPTPGVLEIIMHQEDTPPFFPIIDNVSMA